MLSLEAMPVIKKTEAYWRNRIVKNAVLSPVDRIAEIMYGLIVTLSVTGTISVLSTKEETIERLLWSALGCSLAWGMVDAIMFVMDTLLVRGRLRSVIMWVKQSRSVEERKAILKRELDPLMMELLNKRELEDVGNRLVEFPSFSRRSLLTTMDLMNAIKIFLLVSAGTLPVVAPFVFIDDPYLAMRVSNALAILLLFIGGYVLAGYAGFRRFITAFSYVLIGILLVAITITFGG